MARRAIRGAVFAAVYAAVNAAQAVPSVTPFVDAHTHFDGKDPKGSVAAALAALTEENAAAILLLPPPDTFDNPDRFDAEGVLPAAKEHRGQIAVLGGGGTLNALVQRGAPGDDKTLRERAEALAAAGVVGFGEMTAEHFAGVTPYQSTPPDHPLFLLLAEIAGRHGLPIVLHLEAVPQDMPFPAEQKSAKNPSRLHENIKAFERLLDHERRAKIVWAHLGTDGTGYRTPALCQRLLQAHPNLYMEIKTNGTGKNSVLNGDKLDPSWLLLFEKFPSRFVIGSDQHYPPAAGKPRWQGPVLLLNQLPPELQRAIGRENAMSLYGLSR
jgi:predicted TIM-barrel fold metal-dependent hydrolase